VSTIDNDFLLRLLDYRKLFLVLPQQQNNKKCTLHHHLESFQSLSRENAASEKQVGLNFNFKK
jgi:hypothetical protein